MCTVAYHCVHVVHKWCDLPQVFFLWSYFHANCFWPLFKLDRKLMETCVLMVLSQHTLDGNIKKKRRTTETGIMSALLFMQYKYTPQQKEEHLAQSQVQFSTLYRPFACGRSVLCTSAALVVMQYQASCRLSQRWRTVSLKCWLSVSVEWTLRSSLQTCRVDLVNISQWWS